jgi:hypothetical protein
MIRKICLERRCGQHILLNISRISLHDFLYIYQNPTLSLKARLQAKNVRLFPQGFSDISFFTKFSIQVNKIDARILVEQPRKTDCSASAMASAAVNVNAMPVRRMSLNESNTTLDDKRGELLTGERHGEKMNGLHAP